MSAVGRVDRGGVVPQGAVTAITQVIVILAIVASCAGTLAAQKSAGPPVGTLIVDGGGATEPAIRRFVELAGGRRAEIVVLATGPSATRFGDQSIILNPDWPRDREEWKQYEEHLKRRWASMPFRSSIRAIALSPTQTLLSLRLGPRLACI